MIKHKKKNKKYRQRIDLYGNLMHLFLYHL
jgi:hypothetical protein